MTLIRENLQGQAHAMGLGGGIRGALCAGNLERKVSQLPLLGKLLRDGVRRHAQLGVLKPYVQRLEVGH